jgi:hypothetical protein
VCGWECSRGLEQYGQVRTQLSNIQNVFILSFCLLIVFMFFSNIFYEQDCCFFLLFSIVINRDSTSIGISVTVTSSSFSSYFLLDCREVGSAVMCRATLSADGKMVVCGTSSRCHTHTHVHPNYPALPTPFSQTSSSNYSTQTPSPLTHPHNPTAMTGGVVVYGSGTLKRARPSRPP